MKIIPSNEKIYDQLKVVAICDTDTNALEKVKRKHKLAKYLDLNRMLEVEDLDVVSLCTPSGLHQNKQL